MKAKYFLNLGRLAGIALGAGYALSASAGTPSFAAQQTFATGSFPYALATGDLNGDGVVDVVTTNDGDGTVSVLLNTTPTNASSPTFAAQAVFPVGGYPESVTIADVNGDGLLDIITANAGDNTITVLLNTTAPLAATPSFAAPQVIAVGMDPEALMAADINGDGSPDLVVGNYQDGTIQVLLNATSTGSATVDFSNLTTFATAGAPLKLVAADINGDGLPDITAMNYGYNTVTVMLNTTAPGATTPSFTDPQYFDVGGMGDGIAVIAADVNSDGMLDIAVTDQAAGTVQVLINTTTPGGSVAAFGAPQAFAVGGGPMWVMGVDVDGDGLPDLVTTNNSDNTISVLHNTTVVGSAAVSFDPQLVLAVGSGPQRVTKADVNGDGKLDLIVTNNMDLSVSVLLNTTP